MRQRGNGVRETVESGETAFGAVVATGSPRLVEILGDAGVDFVWVDFEHGGTSPWDADVLEGLTRAADAGETELLVRIPSPDPPLVRKVLDTGVRNLLVPRIEDAETVGRTVEAARFRYDGAVGDRGLAGVRADGWGALDEYTATEDEEVLVGAMVENTTAVENIEEILAVPDLGFVLVGLEDLSMSLGHPREFDHPDVQAAVERVRERANDAGVPVARVCPDGATAEQLAERGYDMVVLGSDIGATRAYFGDRLPE
jgi:2-dehydro-3-deoxyglucarate aldolase